jgi:hypothetical protein
MAHDLLRALGMDPDDPAIAAQIERAKAEYAARWDRYLRTPSPEHGWLHRCWSLLAHLACPTRAVSCGPLHHPGGHHSYRVS